MQRRIRKIRGQTALEYFIMTFLMFSLAIFIRDIFLAGRKDDQKSPVRGVVSDSYGDEKRMGTIGRPYP